MVREAIGQKQIQCDVKYNSTIADVMQYLASQFPSLEKILFENGSISHRFHIMLNEEPIENFDLNLNENDILIIIPPTGGG